MLDWAKDHKEPITKEVEATYSGGLFDIREVSEAIYSGIVRIITPVLARTMCRRSGKEKV